MARSGEIWIIISFARFPFGALTLRSVSRLRFVEPALSGVEGLEMTDEAHLLNTINITVRLY